MPTSTISTIQLPSHHFLCSDKRWYTIDCEPGHVNGWVIIRRRWGGLFNRRGNQKVDIFDNEDRAYKSLQRLLRRRARHGYAVMPIEHERDTTSIDAQGGVETPVAVNLETAYNIVARAALKAGARSTQMDLFAHNP